jgi:hypothetical protein
MIAGMRRLFLRAARSGDMANDPVLFCVLSGSRASQVESHSSTNSRIIAVARKVNDKWVLYY